MIISASYKTDIPAFYGDWFMRRLEAGFCRMVNPYGGQVYRVDLRPETVDGIVFWTKNLGPFLLHLEEVHRRGYPFIVHYTINAYPRQLETSVCHPDRAVDHMRMLADTYVPRTGVWRYDPILVTSLTPIAHHPEQFATLAEKLRGATDEVVISFAHFYRKTLRNLDQAAASHTVTWVDPTEEEKADLVNRFVTIATRNDMRLTVCSQQRYVVAGAAAARCIDADRLQDLAGRPLEVPVQGNREDCCCHKSRDIGDYDTCPHGCVYCYAVNSRSLAQRRHRDHSPDDAFLCRQTV